MFEEVKTWRRGWFGEFVGESVCLFVDLEKVGYGFECLVQFGVYFGGLVLYLVVVTW